MDRLSWSALNLSAFISSFMLPNFVLIARYSLVFFFIAFLISLFSLLSWFTRSVKACLSTSFCEEFSVGGLSTLLAGRSCKGSSTGPPFLQLQTSTGLGEKNPRRHHLKKWVSGVFISILIIEALVPATGAYPALFTS
ncbi:hypothetical protein DPMN_006397 [Dreissena polymorpha]|uniref:Uncharacterized protein n=1 Tax=Dreissena polymorpha TaxID=45954 RepID=A0A9D4MRD6_DREPO|nr:hypothetical protein DPMN_006397 [Dreissena polymorpha]